MELIAKCISKKESINHNENYPIVTTIELFIPSKAADDSSIKLATVTKATADKFKIDSNYKISITPVKE